jgi:hypothetical protein
MAGHSIHLPVANTPEEALKAYTSLERAVVLEVALRFDAKGKELVGDNWFPLLMSTDNHLKFRDEWRSQWDPTFIFGEIAFIASGPIRRTLPIANNDFLKAFDKTRRIRNKWAHDFRPRYLEAVLVDAIWHRTVALHAGLTALNTIDALIARIRGVLDGTWSPQGTEVASLPAVPMSAAAAKQFAEDDAERDAEREAFEDYSYERPVVGESWVGPIPTRKLRLQPNLHDVVDDVTGQSIRDELGDLADTTIERWIQIRPSGELFAAEDDGAVLAYVAGRPRLIGYLGAEPEYPADAIRGFLLPYRFDVSDAGVRCLDTNELLHETAAQDAMTTTQKLQEVAGTGIDFRITTHGDVVRVGDFGIEVVVTVAPSDWFKDQVL